MTFQELISTINIIKIIDPSVRIVGISALAIYQSSYFNAIDIDVITNDRTLYSGFENYTELEQIDPYTTTGKRALCTLNNQTLDIFEINEIDDPNTYAQEDGYKCQTTAGYLSYASNIKPLIRVWWKNKNPNLSDEEIDSYPTLIKLQENIDLTTEILSKIK